MERISLFLFVFFISSSLNAQQTSQRRTFPHVKSFDCCSEQIRWHYVYTAYLDSNRRKHSAPQYSSVVWRAGQRLPDSISLEEKIIIDRSQFQSFAELREKLPFDVAMMLKADSILIDSLGLDLFFNSVFMNNYKYYPDPDKLVMQYGLYIDTFFFQNFCVFVWDKKGALIEMKLSISVPEIVQLKASIGKIKARIEKDNEVKDTYDESFWILSKEQSYSGSTEIGFSLFHRSVGLLSKNDTHRLFKDHYRAYFFDTEGELLELEREVRTYWYNGFDKHLHPYRDKRDYSPFIRELVEYRKQLKYLLIDENFTMPIMPRKWLNQLDFIIRIFDDTKPVPERRSTIWSRRGDDY